MFSSISPDSKIGRYLKRETEIERIGGQLEIQLRSKRVDEIWDQLNRNSSLDRQIGLLMYVLPASAQVTRRSDKYNPRVDLSMTDLQNENSKHKCNCDTNAKTKHETKPKQFPKHSTGGFMVIWWLFN